MLMSIFFLFCRDFDEVLSSFVEPLLESTSFSESCSGLYEEDNFKESVGRVKVVDVDISSATGLSYIHYRM